MKAAAELAQAVFAQKEDKEQHEQQGEYCHEKEGSSNGATCGSNAGESAGYGDNEQPKKWKKIAALFAKIAEKECRRSRAG